MAFQRSFWGLFIAAFLVLGGLNDARAEEKTHKVVLQVDQNDAAIMNLALNNMQNIISYYKGKGEKVTVELVTFGPGLEMLRLDNSPVAERIGAIAKDNPEVQFSACQNTMQAVAKKEGGEKPPLLDSATEVPSGVVRIIELQQQGYAYIRP